MRYYFHHRHEIAETREALRLEREENYKLMEKFVHAYKVESAMIENNRLVLAALRQHPGTPADKLPGVLAWRMTRNQFLTSAWHTAQSDGVLALMPKAEVLRDEKVYDALRDITNENEEEWLALNDTWSFELIDLDPSHLTAAQIADLTTALQKQMMKHYLRGNFMGYPHHLDPSFDSGPPNAELLKFHQANVDIQSDAAAKTTARLKTAGGHPVPSLRSNYKRSLTRA